MSVGGKFTQVAHETDRFAQPFIAAFDAATGVWIDSWAPAFDGPVYALHVGVTGYDIATGEVVLATPSTTASITVLPGSEVAVRALDAAGNRSWRSNSQPR